MNRFLLSPTDSVYLFKQRLIVNSSALSNKNYGLFSFRKSYQSDNKLNDLFNYNNMNHILNTLSAYRILQECEGNYELFFWECLLFFISKDSELYSKFDLSNVSGIDWWHYHPDLPLLRESKLVLNEDNVKLISEIKDNIKLNENAFEKIDFPFKYRDIDPVILETNIVTPLSQNLYGKHCGEKVCGRKSCNENCDVRPCHDCAEMVNDFNYFISFVWFNFLKKDTSKELVSFIIIQKKKNLNFSRYDVYYSEFENEVFFSKEGSQYRNYICFYIIKFYNSKDKNDLLMTLIIWEDMHDTSFRIKTLTMTNFPDLNDFIVRDCYSFKKFGFCTEIFSTFKSQLQPVQIEWSQLNEFFLELFGIESFTCSEGVSTPKSMYDRYNLDLLSLNTSLKLPRIGNKYQYLNLVFLKATNTLIHFTREFIEKKYAFLVDHNGVLINETVLELKADFERRLSKFKPVIIIFIISFEYELLFIFLKLCFFNYYRVKLNILLYN